VAEAAMLACLLEVTAAKPGNVTRYHDLPDLALTDFLASAVVIGPAMAAAGQQAVGATIVQAVRATRRRVATNTNLGIILLLAPLATAALRLTPPGASLRQRVGVVLESLTVEDAQQAYAAIRLAMPGGLGSVEQQDVTAAPTVDLRAAMALAADRDSIAREYATGFATTFEVGYPALLRLLEQGPVQEATVGAYLTLLAHTPDTLIVRRHGSECAEEVRRRAEDALRAGGRHTTQGREAIANLDRWLRAARPRLNPGTTADLVTAALFVALLHDQGPLAQSAPPQDMLP